MSAARRPPRRDLHRGPSLATLHLREVLRNPWVWPAGLAVALLAVGFRDRDGAVALVSLVAALQSYVPPLLLVLTAPLLTRRETWAFWSGLHAAPGRAYLSAAAGVGLGAAVPLAAGAALASWILGLPAAHLGLMLAALAALIAVWTCVAALLAALTLDPTRALAIGLAVWAIATLAYGPLVVGLASAAVDRPLAGLLIGALLANPAEAVRVGLLEALDVPVLVGPVAILLRESLPGPTLVWGLVVSGASAGVLGGLAALVYGRRNR